MHVAATGISGVANTGAHNGGIFMKFQRNTISYYFLMALSVLIISGGIFSVVMDSIYSLSIVLSGVGLLFLILWFTENDKNRSQIFIIAALLSYSTAGFIASYTYYLTDRFTSALFFAVSSVLCLIFVGIFTYRRGK